MRRVTWKSNPRFVDEAAEYVIATQYVLEMVHGRNGPFGLGGFFRSSIQLIVNENAQLRL